MTSRFDDQGVAADVAARLRRSIAAHQRGQLWQAQAGYEGVLRQQPRNFDALHLLGVIAYQTGAYQKSAELLARALAVDPAFAPAHLNLGNSLKALRRFDDAIASYDRAIALKPDYADAHFNRGTALQDLKRPEQALASFERAIALRPGFAAAQINRAMCLRDLCRAEEVEHALRLALAHEPGSAKARWDLAVLPVPGFVETVEQGSRVSVELAARLDELGAWGTAHLDKLGRIDKPSQPFFLAYRPGNHREILSRFGDLCGGAFGAAYGGRVPPAAAAARAGERIRLGIVTAQARRHSVWDVITRGIVANLDRRLFEVLVYHTCAEADDETTWAMEHVDAFRQEAGSVESLIDRILADRPDVLLYPEIGMDPLCLKLASLRLAPLQAASWGHPVTTGLPTIDVFLSGDLIEGPDADTHYRERLIRLPGTGVCTKPLEVEPEDVDDLFEALREDAECVHLALCHASFKFDPAFDALYPAIARAVGRCRFWLVEDAVSRAFSERLVKRLSGAFASAGLDPGSHLVTMPRLNPGRFRGFLDRADVYLDCPAFSGYTTAWQALRRGLPVVTLEGDAMRQRLAAGLLRKMDATEGVAATPEAYVAIASRLAIESKDPARRQARRATLAASIDAAENQVDVVRALERAIAAELYGRGVRR